MRAKKVVRLTTVWTLGHRLCSQRSLACSHAAFPLKPAPSAVQTALHVSRIGAQHRHGKMRWNKPEIGPDQERYWRNSLAAKHQLCHGDRHLQGYEDDLSNLEKALKKSDKHDTDRPHLCRAIWRRKRARRRHVYRQNKWECCEEKRAPPGQAKSKHLNWERVFGNSDDPKGLSYFYSAISEFPYIVEGQTLRQAEDEHRKWCVGSWRTRIADTPTFKCDEELLPKCIKKLKKHKNFAYGGTAEIF